MPHKDERLAYDQRAMEIVAQMTLAEKVKLMSGKKSVLKIIVDIVLGRGFSPTPFPAGGNERLGVPELRFCDGPRGVVAGASTCFPVTMARGASFDRDLEERVGEAIGKEVRGVGGNLFGGVCINLPYNPGWGRSQEVYGEDSQHLGKMGSALVRGVQKHNVLACIKHYAFNSMELARFKVNIKADKRTEREVYLRHFKECVDAGAAVVMSAYNQYQGEFCGQNDYLLNQVLKGEWGFDGIVITDFVYGLKDTAKGANAGQDVEMPDGVHFTVKMMRAAIEQGLVKEETIDRAAVRVVRTLLAFTEAKDPQEYSAALCACEAHIALAREVAEKSITLLKNEAHTLPFDATQTKKVVLVGDLGAVQNIGDHGSSHIMRAKADTVLEALKQRFGVENVTFIKTKDVGASVDKVYSADAVIIMAGMRHSDEGEYISTSTKIGGDRKVTLGLQPGDIEMIRQVGRINKNTAVVLIGGSMVMVDPWFEGVPAVVMAYYPGVQGGLATTRVLFGDVNPSGKIPFVIPHQESDLPQVDWLADEQVYGYYHGYAKLDKEGIQPKLPFGHGLSYTTFELSGSQLKSNLAGVAIFEVEVKNVGTCAGGEVVQLYSGWNGSSVDRPVKRLQDFAKAYLQPGECKRLTLAVAKADLAYYDGNTRAWVEEDLEYTAFIGTDANQASMNTITFRYA